MVHSAQSAVAHAAPMRLDPYKITERISFENSKGTSYTIDKTGVSLKKVMDHSGLPLSLALPTKSFKGVAARVVELEDGSHHVTLELHHKDPQLCVPLLVSDNLDDIAADWHSWSRLMKLPMLIIGADEIAQPVRDTLGMVMVEAPIERRKRLRMIKHRTWFARRRKVGQVGEVEKLNAREIIARN